MNAPQDPLRAAVDDLHRWDVSRGWPAFNVILARIDAALPAATEPAPEPDATLRGIGYSGEEIRTGKLTRFGPGEGSAQSESAVCVAGTTPRQAATEPADGLRLDPDTLLATLRDRFHEARAGTPEWRDGVRLGLEMAMNEVGYWRAEPVPGDGG